MNTVMVGIGERDITPVHPVPLAGFAVRQNKPFEAVDRNLWVRAWWIGDGADAILLVVADVLWWAPERERAFRELVTARWHIPAERVLLHATHTHSAPQTSFVFVDSLGSPDDEWVARFEASALEAIDDAYRDRTPAVISRHVGSSHIGYNRRVQVDEPNAPENANGLVDPTLTALAVNNPDGSRRGLLLHFACHPTITSRAYVSSEWPGIACELLGGQHGVVSVLQGTCGDINPRVTRGVSERNFSDRDVEAVAREFVADVLAALEGPDEELVLNNVTSSSATVDCLMQSVPDELTLTAASTGDELDREWASALRRFPDRCVAEQPLHLGYVSFGNTLGFFALSAEVTTSYGIAIKETGGKNILPLGYTNGMTGYIVTDTQLANGGYESDSSARYFALPSKFAQGLESTVLTGVRSLLEPKVTS